MDVLGDVHSQCSECSTQGYTTKRFAESITDHLGDATGTPGHAVLAFAQGHVLLLLLLPRSTHVHICMQDFERCNNPVSFTMVG
jgi:hypothetical protein